MNKTSIENKVKEIEKDLTISEVAGGYDSVRATCNGYYKKSLMTSDIIPFVIALYNKAYFYAPYKGKWQRKLYQSLFESMHGALITSAPRELTKEYISVLKELGYGEIC